MSAFLIFLFFSVTLTCEARPEDQKVYDDQIDQIDQIEPRNEENGNVEENSMIEPELALFEGDIALPLNSSSNQWEGAKGTYVVNDRKIWPQGVVPFKIDTTSIVENEHQELIRQGLKELAEVATCLTFNEVTGEAVGDTILFRAHGDANYMGKGCWSYVGRKGGTQVINLEPPECMDLEHIKHEVLHSLGAIHEHSRPDRNKHIRILEENVQNGKLSNFKIAQWSYEDDLKGVEDFGAPYDIYSIMHYPHDALGRNNSRTIEAVNPKITEFGSTGDLSLTDVMKINLLYQCDIDSNKIVDYLHEMVIKDEFDLTADILKTVEEKNDKLQEDTNNLQSKVEAQEKRIEELEIKNIDYKGKLDGLLRDMEQMKHSMTNLEQNNDKNVGIVQSRLESHENESKEILSGLEDTLSGLEDTVEDLSSLNLKRTCQEYADSGIKRSGYFWLDPDGPLNPANRIRVWCSITSESVVTEVLHDSEMTTSITHCSQPGCYKRNITYSSSRSQLRALMEISEHCYQDIRYDCTLAPLREGFHNIDYAFWFGDNGKKNIHWNDFNNETSLGDHFCACHLKSQCFDGHTCNCNSHMASGKFDEGRITDINILPIRELRFGGLQHSFQSAQHTLGRLKCRGRKPVEYGSSCEALRIAGNYWSGYYNVGNGDDVQIVFCNMTSNPWDDSEMETFTESLSEEIEEMHANFSTQLDYLEMAMNQTLENVETTLTKMPGPPGKQGKKGNQGNVGPKGIKGELGLVGRIGPKGDNGSIGLQGIMGLKGMKGDNGQFGEKGTKGKNGEIGVQGINGPRGEKGETGLKGTGGITGISGSKGAIGLSGNSGPRGIKGEAGKKGEDGEQGVKGTQGLHGLKGKNGFNGKKGDNGSKGNKGENGLKGNNGINGAKGKKGEVGLKGIRGISGISGIKGSKGVIGLPGNSGTRGNKGEAGNKGEDGKQGVKGDQGLHGLNGNNGFNGKKGENGSKGITGENGLKGIRGMTGISGIKGSNGVIGLPGNSGPRGNKGEVGNKGEDGAQGVKGAQGQHGLKGNNGFNGKKGENGSKGNNGENGLKGDNGINGAKGVIGRQGIKGKQGLRGLKGVNGFRGEKGENGSKGSKGEKGFKGNNGLKGVKGDKAQISSQWKGYVYSLVCHYVGSRSEKAKKILEVLKKGYPDENRFIGLIDENGGFAFKFKTGGREYLKKLCGYNLLIWTRADSDFSKTSCSTAEQDKVKVIMKSAESSGSSSISIRDEIISQMSLFKIEYHFIWVDSDTSSREGTAYLTCYVQGGKDYNIVIYLA